MNDHTIRTKNGDARVPEDAFLSYQRGKDILDRARIPYELRRHYQDDWGMIFGLRGETEFYVQTIYGQSWFIYQRVVFRDVGELVRDMAAQESLVKSILQMRENNEYSIGDYIRYWRFRNVKITDDKRVYPQIEFMAEGSLSHPDNLAELLLSLEERFPKPAKDI